MKRVLAALLILSGCAALITLGIWQVHRLAWKENLIAGIDRYQSESVDLRPYVAAPDAEFRRGTITGVWDETSVFATKNITMNGNFGHWIATTLDLGGGQSILVNRGWVQEGQQNRVVEAPLPRGPVTVAGTLRRPGLLDGYVVNKNAGPWVLFAEKPDHPDLIPAPIAATLRNDHKQYAIFWFAMAGILAAFGIFSLLKGRSASLPNP